MPLPTKWRELISPETAALAEELSKKARTLQESGVSVYPPEERIFAALNATAPERVKAVIVGQDPYHRKGQADGLAFSVDEGVKLPPSLKNIFKELNEDLGIPAPTSGSLARWAEEGVLLLNTSLTVLEGSPGSCSGWGWQRVTGEIFSACELLPQPVVFMLWGAHAQSLRRGDAPGKLAIMSSHPSPLGAKKPCGATPPFSGSRPFSRANLWLAENGAEPVDWRL